MPRPGQNLRVWGQTPADPGRTPDFDQTPGQTPDFDQIPGQTPDFDSQNSLKNHQALYVDVFSEIKRIY